MAERLDSFEFSSKSRTGRYPWDTWFDGAPWKLIRGEDFRTSARDFRATAIGAGSRRAGRLMTSIIDENTVVIQFVTNEENGRPLT